MSERSQENGIVAQQTLYLVAGNRLGPGDHRCRSFFVNAMIPSISLAAAFALGAALGPTDPIAVSAASKDADISPRCKALLKGESLINDARVS